MAKIPVEIGALRFETKGAAQDRFREILYRYEFEQRIPDPDATELEWLLERHPEFNDKLGAGIDYFSVRRALYGTRCRSCSQRRFQDRFLFWILRQWEGPVAPERSAHGTSGRGDRGHPQKKARMVPR